MYIVVYLPFSSTWFYKLVSVDYPSLALCVVIWW